MTIVTRNGASTTAPKPPRDAAPPRREGSRSSGAVTLQDVARLAGVGPATVSRVLNKPELVTAETLEKVRKVIAQTGYVPNLLAGGLASRRSRLVAAIVPTIGNSIFAEAVEALSEKLGEAGYKVLLGLSGYPATSEDDLVSAILSRVPDAIFLTGINHSVDTRLKLLAAKIPIVETWDMTPTPIDMLVGFSHEKLGAAVADHLVERGYRSFGMIWADDERAAARRQGFQAALARHGMPAPRINLVSAPGNQKKGREGLAQMLADGDCPQAVFCSSDVLAQGVLTEAQARDLKVPGDVAVIGFGDLDFAAYTWPALSTVRIDRRALGAQAAAAILARLGGGQPPTVVDIGFEIIPRESS